MRNIPATHGNDIENEDPGDFIPITNKSKTQNFNQVKLTIKSHSENSHY